MTQHAVDGTQQKLAKIGHQPRHDRLALGITEADVELDQLGPLRRQHQAGIEHALERRPLGRHPGQRRPDDLSHHPIDGGRVEHGCRRVGAHAAGVGPEIAVEGALVVLGGADLQRMAAVAQGKEARLLAGQELLDHERGAGLPKHSTHGGPDGIQRLVVAGRDHYPFAGREPVGLDDYGQRMLADIGLGSGSLAGPEGPEACGRYPMPLAEALGESLGALKAGRGGARSEGLDPGRLQPVHDPQHQGQLGADHHEVDRPLPRQGHDAVQVVHLQPDALGDLRDPGIARGAEDARHGW